MDLFLNALIDAVEDAAKLIPFLYVSYLFIEFIEHEASDKLVKRLYGMKRNGPIYGAIAGLMPMCGLSVTAADLYAGRLITPGMLVAEFAAETDEAIPILLGYPGFRLKGVLLAAVSLAVGIAAGYGADRLFPDRSDREHSHEEHEMLHKDEEDDCEKQGLFLTALLHTLKSLAFVFAAVFALNLLVEAIGEERYAALFSGGDWLEPVLAALVGLIPNCAPSIILPEMYMQGLISFGTMLSGLTMNAGVGVAMLWSSNRDRKENLLICLYIFGVSLLFGYALQLAGI